MQNQDHRIVLQRKLRFEEEEIWTELPESTREHCRGLWRQLLESVLNSGDPVDSGSSEQSAQPCEVGANGGRSVVAALQLFNHDLA